MIFHHQIAVIIYIIITIIVFADGNGRGANKHNQPVERSNRRSVSSKDCKDDQPFPNRYDCHKFFQCIQGTDGEWILTMNTCDTNSHYDRHKKMCVDGYECKNPPQQKNPKKQTE